MRRNYISIVSSIDAPIGLLNPPIFMYTSHSANHSLSLLSTIPPPRPPCPSLAPLTSRTPIIPPLSPPTLPNTPYFVHAPLGVSSVRVVSSVLTPAGEIVTSTEALHVGSSCHVSTLRNASFALFPSYRFQEMLMPHVLMNFRL